MGVAAPPAASAAGPLAIRSQFARVVTAACASPPGAPEHRRSLRSLPRPPGRRHSHWRTPWWCEHVPCRCWEYEKVPSLQIAVGPPAATVGAGVEVRRWVGAGVLAGRCVRFGFGLGFLVVGVVGVVGVVDVVRVVGLVAGEVTAAWGSLDVVEVTAPGSFAG